MAYAAVTSLMHTISRFLKPCGDIQIVENSSSEMIELLEEEAHSLAEVLEELDCNTKRFSSKRLNALDAQIRDAIFKLEDVVESHLLHQFVSQSQNYIHRHPLVFSLDIEELKQDIDSLVRTVKKKQKKYIYELSNNNYLPNDDEEQEEEEKEEEVIVKTELTGFGSNKLLVKIIGWLLRQENTYGPLEIYGMAGIGKTTLARKVFEDPSISSHFSSRAFITVGPQYQLECVLLDILKQVAPKSSIHDDEEIIMPPQRNHHHQEKLRWLVGMLSKYLKDRKCLLVLDDVWDEEITAFKCFSMFLNPGNWILVTSRLKGSVRYMHTWKIPFMDKKESWDLLCAKVFGEDSSSSLCTPQLVRAGKKIAENCEGLPLTIVTVANILSKNERTPDFWNEVVANKQHPVYKEAYAKMHKVLLPSYYNLPQYLRISFLYMGIFPQNYEIPCSNLLMLWTVEGFNQLENEEYSVYDDHFEELFSNSVLLVHSTSTTRTHKSVGLHSSFWYLCKKEAAKIKFFHSFATLDDCFPQGIETQRRLCIYNPVLFAIKDAFHKMESVLGARSLLCTGVYHQYPVLLRVLEALSIHFYKFPIEVLELIHLSYFALTCDGELPASISKLWNLKYLIVDRRLRIVSSAGATSHLPVEIWDMKKLKHLQVMGSDLPEPPQESHAMLLKLSKLLDVSPLSCTKRILESIPGLTKLGIRIELSPDDDVVHQPLGCLDHMSELRSFKCVVVNPRIMFEVAAPPPIPLPIFPNYLKKLTLSGLGYPWEEMRKISSLPELRVLKLLSYAFRGPKWDVQGKEFPSLQVLEIEETNLVQWTVKDDYCIENLTLLIMKHCYKLKEIPMYLSENLHKIEVVDCNPLVVHSANKIKEADKFDYINLNVHSSWDDRKLA